MRKMLYTRQDEVYASSDLGVTMAGFAQDLGIDTTPFNTCMQDHKHLAAVQADYGAAQAEACGRGRCSTSSQVASALSAHSPSRPSSG